MFTPDPIFLQGYRAMKGVRAYASLYACMQWHSRICLYFECCLPYKTNTNLKLATGLNATTSSNHAAVFVLQGSPYVGQCF